MMKSITLEDTFNDYEPSVWKYDTQYNEDDIEYIVCDSTRIQSDQMISKTKIVKKMRIVPYWRTEPKTIEENLRTKHYIRIGEECPICYEAIIHKKTAFLTSCGHAFHYKCIMDCDFHHSLTTNCNNKMDMKCPMCRQNMGYYPELKNKYLFGSNKLDRLENQNDTLQFTNPKICYTCNKIKGFNKSCIGCQRYIHGKDHKYAYF